MHPKPDPHSPDFGMQAAGACCEWKRELLCKGHSQFSPRGVSPFWLGRSNRSVTCLCSPGYWNRKSYTAKDDCPEKMKLCSKRTTANPNYHFQKKAKHPQNSHRDDIMYRLPLNLLQPFPWRGHQQQQRQPHRAHPHHKDKTSFATVAVQGVFSTILIILCIFFQLISLQREKSWKDTLKLQKQEWLKKRRDQRSVI